MLDASFEMINTVGTTRSLNITQTSLTQIKE